ncbi:MAG: exonuclease domain-containing protein [bacterium]
MQFVSIDLETANARRRSICQIGIVTFDDDREIFAEKRLVDPCDLFDPFNVSIHGIEAADVAGEPAFGDLAGWITDRLTGKIVASHSAFDCEALGQAFRHHGMECPACVWIDTAEVARNAWPGLPGSGYGLANLARQFGMTFRHHDAVEDARFSGLILIRAVRETKVRLADCVLNLEGMFEPDEAVLVPRRALWPKGANADVRRPAGGEGPLAEEVVVFTGNLGLTRGAAADLAHAAGAAVENGVTKRTTILVVGDQDIKMLAGKAKSSKHLKAESLIANGKAIRILQESEFMAIVAGAEA